MNKNQKSIAVYLVLAIVALVAWQRLNPLRRSAATGPTIYGSGGFSSTAPGVTATPVTHAQIISASGGRTDPGSVSPYTGAPVSNLPPQLSFIPGMNAVRVTGNTGLPVMSGSGQTIPGAPGMLQGVTAEQIWGTAPNLSHDDAARAFANSLVNGGYRAGIAGGQF